jgi:hypothetical protein
LKPVLPVFLVCKDIGRPVVLLTRACRGTSFPSGFSQAKLFTYFFFSALIFAQRALAVARMRAIPATEMWRFTGVAWSANVRASRQSATSK